MTNFVNRHEQSRPSCTHLADLETLPLQHHGLRPLGVRTTHRYGPQAQPLGSPRPSNPMALPSTTVLALDSRMHQIAMPPWAISQATGLVGELIPTTRLPLNSRKTRFSPSPDTTQSPRCPPAQVSRQWPLQTRKWLAVQRTTQSYRVVLLATSRKAMNRWYVVFESRDRLKLFCSLA